MYNIKINSRNVKPGDTFVAIVGHQVDGHKYVEDAIKNGASKVIVSNGKTYDVETINVPDTQEYINNYIVENYANEFKDIKFIGITGTNGKTTIAYMTYQVLRKLGVKAAYIGTIGFMYNDNFQNTLNTTPDIVNLYELLFTAKNAGCTTIILEASSVALLVGRLNGIKFDATIYTNLTHEHMEEHHTMKNYLNAKLLINKQLKENGVSIVNMDDKYGHYFQTENTLSYGFDDEDMICISHNDLYNEFDYKYKDTIYHIKSKLYGEYNIYNIMASLLALDYLGYDLKKISDFYSELIPPKGRMNLIECGTNKIIIDYAHTPDGVEKVLKAAVNLTKGNIYTVFGCVGSRESEKRPMMGHTVNKFSHYFIVTDDDPHYDDEMQIALDTTKGLDQTKFEIIIDRKKAIEKGIALLKDNDTLLILGKGHENAIIIKDKAIPHNDEEYVRKILNDNNIKITND